MTASDELRATWLEWVVDNLGRDPVRASMAADAALGATVEGHGFASAAEAARAAWIRGAPVRRLTAQSRRRDPLGVLAFVLGAASLSMLVVARAAWASALLGLILLAGVLTVAAVMVAMVAIVVGIAATQRNGRRRGIALGGLAMGAATTVGMLWWAVASATTPVG